MNTVKIKNSKGEEQEVTAIPELLDTANITNQPLKISVVHEDYKGKVYAKEVKVEPWVDAPPLEDKDPLPF